MIKRKVFKYIMILFGYEQTISLSNKYHEGRIDKMQLSDLVTTHPDGVIAAMVDNKNTKCICCKNKPNTSYLIQRSHYLH